MEEAGRKLYEQFASGNCHDPEGTQRGPSLAGIYGKPVRLANGQTVIADDIYLRKSILNPNEQIAEKFQQAMPSYKGQVTEEQLLQLIAYIKTIGTTAGPTFESATGRNQGSGLEVQGSGPGNVGFGRR